MGQLVAITYKGKVLQEVGIEETYLALCNWDIENIREIEGLGQLVHLEQLNLSSNRLTRIEGLDRFANLRVLWLPTNRITRIEGLDQLVQLEELHLSSNQITRVEGLGRLVHLKTLSLEDTEIPFTFFDDMGGLLFKNWGVLVKNLKPSSNIASTEEPRNQRKPR